MNSKQRGLVSLGVMAVLSGATILGSESVYNALQKNASESAGENAITTSAAGFGGDVSVATTVGEDGSIADVAIVDCSSETPEIGGAAAPEVAKAIVDAQSIEVDGVAGATLTSDAVKAAVADALAQAGVAVPTEETEAESEAAGETEAKEESEAVSETEAEAEEKAESAGETEAEEEKAEAAGETEAEEEKAEAAGETEAEEKAEVADETKAEETETADETEAAPAAAESSEATDLAVEPGEYVASAKGYGGDVKVGAVMNADGSIGAIKILDMSSETADIGQKAAPEVAKQIVLAQSADVDGVAGATMTSDAVIEAAAMIFVGGGTPAESTDKEALEAASAEETEETEAEQAEESTVIGGADGPTSVYLAPAAGEYTASAQGYSDDISVSVIINADGSIGAVKILDMGAETPEVGQQAAVEVAEQIVLAQSADVDGVAGATITTNAVKEAVGKILAGEE